jgi:hypothetical protein
VDGSFPCPPPEIDNPKVVEDSKAPALIYNPEYTTWHQQDAAIISTIMSTSTEPVQGLILFTTTAQDAWAALAASFSSQSTARFMAIRGQLQDLKKLDSTITTYFNKAQGLADTLTSIGEPLRPQEFIGYVLAGLDEDYDSVHAAISNRTTPITIRELYAQLLATEQRLEAHKSELRGGRDFHSANATGYSKGGKVPYPRAVMFARILVINPGRSSPTNHRPDLCFTPAVASPIVAVEAEAATTSAADHAMAMSVVIEVAALKMQTGQSVKSVTRLVTLRLDASRGSRPTTLVSTTTVVTWIAKSPTPLPHMARLPPTT